MTSVADEQLRETLEANRALFDAIANVTRAQADILKAVNEVLGFSPPPSAAPLTLEQRLQQHGCDPTRAANLAKHQAHPKVAAEIEWWLDR